MIRVQIFIFERFPNTACACMYSTSRRRQANPKFQSSFFRVFIRCVDHMMFHLCWNSWYIDCC